MPSFFKKKKNLNKHFFDFLIIFFILWNGKKTHTTSISTTVLLKLKDGYKRNKQMKGYCNIMKF